MQDSAGLLIDAGDNPPDEIQLTVTNAERLSERLSEILPKGDLKTVHDLKTADTRLLGMERIRLGKDLTMDQFRFTTPLFTAVVPQAPYGISMKDFLEEGSIASGTYSAMLDAYFVMIKFHPPQNEAEAEVSKTYWIHSWASAGREPRGPYFSELLYEVELSQRPDRQNMVTTRFPARNEGVLLDTIKKKEREFSLKDIAQIMSVRRFARNELSALVKNGLNEALKKSEEGKKAP